MKCQQNLKIKSVEFTATPAPITEMEKVAPYTTSAAIVIFVPLQSE